MSNKKNHNTIYFLTTLSVYLGLVIVGASPQVLAQAQISESSQTRTFEISTKTNSVFPELKLQTKFQYDDVLPFAFLGNPIFTNRVWNSHPAIESSANLYSEVIAVNNQIFTVPILPRASI